MSRLLRAEALKLSTTRTPWVILAIIVVLSGLIGIAFVSTDVNEEDPALSLMEAVNFLQLIVTVLGILVVTNEYRHGTIASTFLISPRRERVLFAKGLTGVWGGLLAGLLGAGVALAIALGFTDDIPVDDRLAGALGRTLASFVLAAVLGIAVGAIIQNQVGAIAVTFVWFFVAEPVISLIAARISGDGTFEDPVSRYLLGPLLERLVAPRDPGELSFWPALLLASGYVLALLVLGLAWMRRRDPV